MTKTRDVYEWCTALETTRENPEKASREDWYKAGICDGFFSGMNVGEYLQYLVHSSKEGTAKSGAQLSEEFNTSRAWCEPSEGLTLRQRLLIFNKYVNEHPESLHKDAYHTLVMAMKPHFPCTQ